MNNFDKRRSTSKIKNFATSSTGRKFFAGSFFFALFAAFGIFSGAFNSFGHFIK